MNSQSFDRLIKALLDGDQSVAVAEAVDLRNAGVDNEQIIIGGIETAMGKLDAKCTVEQFNLLEIMLAGRAVTGVIKALYPDGPPPATRETVALASLEGDVHDLGKNIVKTVLLAKGYRVVDCGKDCPVETLIDKAEREGAGIICISGLITSVMPLVRTGRSDVADTRSDRHKSPGRRRGPEAGVGEFAQCALCRGFRL